MNSDADIDLAGVFAGLWRNKFRIIVASLFVTLLVFVFLQTLSSRYRSEARILIRSSAPVLSSTGSDQLSAQTDLDEQGIASQVQLLQSREIARKVVERLDLTSNPEFNSALAPSKVESILAAFGLSDNDRLVTPEDRVLDAYFSGLKIYQANKARVIVVQFSSRDPKLAAAIPNAISDEYISLQDELKRGIGPGQLSKLEPELKALRESVVAAEAAVADFRSSSDLLEGANSKTLATQELSELSTELGKVRAQLSSIEANAASVSRALETGSLDTVSSVLQSPLIQRLRERRIALGGQLTDLSTTLLSQHPRIKSLRSQIAALDGQVANEARKIERALRQDAATARRREAKLVQQRNVLKSESGRVGRAEVELRALEREADAQRQLLNQYLVRFKEAKSRQNSQFLPADAYVFSKAQTPSKSYFPKKLPILIGSFFGSLMVGSMIVVVSSVLAGPKNPSAYAQPPLARALDEEPHSTSPNSRSRLLEEVRSARQQLDSPSLAYEYSGDVKSEMHTGPGQPTEEPTIEPGQLMSNAQVVAKSLATLGPARVAIVTPDPAHKAEGGVVLARLLASQGLSVVLLDLTASGLPTSLMTTRQKLLGIKDVLAGTCALGDALHRDAGSKAHIMPNGQGTVHTAMKKAAKLPVLLDALQNTYQFVMIECGRADLDGLLRVSDSETFNILYTCDHESVPTGKLCAKMQRSGVGAPLVLQLTSVERELLAHAAA